MPSTAQSAAPRCSVWGGQVWPNCSDIYIKPAGAGNDQRSRAFVTAAGTFNIKRVAKHLLGKHASSSAADTAASNSSSSGEASAQPPASDCVTATLVFRTRGGDRLEFRGCNRGRAVCYRADRLRQITGTAGDAAHPIEAELVTREAPGKAIQGICSEGPLVV